MIKSHSIWSESDIDEAHNKAWEGRQKWEVVYTYKLHDAARRYYAGPSIVKQIKRRNRRRICVICLLQDWKVRAK